MNHEALKSQLFALYDGELGGKDRQEVQAHLEGCAECRGIYEGWSATAKTFFKPVSLPASEFFVRQVMERVREVEEPRRIFEWNFSLEWLVPSIGIATLLLALVPFMPQPASLDAFLYQEMGDRSPWMISNAAVTTDDTLQFVMEGAS